MDLHNITIGSDPELFIINTKTDKVVSAIPFIPGVKGNPWRGDDMPEGFGLETDNILAEFNIPPTRNKDEFISAILYMQNYIDKFVKNIDPDLGIKCIASQIVPESELQSKQAKQFGCDVDYNVYTKKANPKPKGNKTNIRSCGFHIHFGYDNPNIDTSLSLIKYFDTYIGIPSILIDKDTNRRTLYGKAGCFRLTKYGFEYRTLSSTMMSSKENLEFVWKQIWNAVHAYEYDFEIPNDKSIQTVINNNDIELAEKLISLYKLQ